MSADTESGADPSAEIEGFHDHIAQAEEAAEEGRWNDAVGHVTAAKSLAMKRRAVAARRGEIDV